MTMKTDPEPKTQSADTAAPDAADAASAATGAATAGSAEPEADAPAADAPEAAPDSEAPDAAAPAAELAALRDSHLRLMADFDNFRRRVARDREELVKRANEDLVESMLPALDAMDIAMRQRPAGDDPFAKGIAMVFDLFRKALADAGLEAVDAAGKDFDPQFHEAIVYTPSPSVPEGGVIEQTRRGYTLNGRLLRPAQVVVSSGAPAGSEPEADGNAPGPASAE